MVWDYYHRGKDYWGGGAKQWLMDAEEICLCVCESFYYPAEPTVCVGHPEQLLSPEAEWHKISCWITTAPPSLNQPPPKLSWWISQRPEGPETRWFSCDGQLKWTKQKKLFLQGIVHFEINFWYVLAYLKGIQDVGVFVVSILIFFGQTVLVCQTYNGGLWSPP